MPRRMDEQWWYEISVYDNNLHEVKIYHARDSIMVTQIFLLTAFIKYLFNFSVICGDENSSCRINVSMWQT